MGRARLFFFHLATDHTQTTPLYHFLVFCKGRTLTMYAYHKMWYIHDCSTLYHSCFRTICTPQLNILWNRNDGSPGKPRLQSDSDFLGIIDLLTEPAETMGDAMDMRIHGDTADLAPGKVHDQVSHLRTNARK